MHCKSYSHFFSEKYQNICVSLDVNFNESLTNDIVSFEQLGPDYYDFNVLQILNLLSVRLASRVILTLIYFCNSIINASPLEKI